MDSNISDLHDKNKNEEVRETHSPAEFFCTTELLETVKDNFFVYSKIAQSQNISAMETILFPVIQDVMNFILKWKYQDIEQKRVFRKQELSRLEEDECLIIEKEYEKNVWDWKDMIQELTTVLYKKNMLWYIPLHEFFDIPLVEEKNFTPTDEWYYKWISLNILLMRQLVCEEWKHFDEYLDCFTPYYDTARSYAWGSRNFYNPSQKGHILCINKQKLQDHILTLKWTPNKNEQYYIINKLQDDERYLYHTIVPISCIDRIIILQPEK
jgi:hypothetical protein